MNPIHSIPPQETSLLSEKVMRTRFILLDTSHAGNIGAAARAMKVMGFDDLVLVRPRFADVLKHDEAIAMASGAQDVLEQARVVDDLAQALDGINWVCATAMTPRDFGPPTHTPRTYLPQLKQQKLQGVAFVFGGERFGMSNEDVYRCHVCLSIPTAAGYGSLNLAQAIQVLAYEWRQALGGFDEWVPAHTESLADGAAIQGLLSHWQRVLVDLGFLNPAAPKKLMPRLNQWLNRSQLTEQEVHILRGIARCIERSLSNPVSNPVSTEPLQKGS